MHLMLFLVFVSVVMLIFYAVSLKLYWKRKKIRSIVMSGLLGSVRMLCLQTSPGDFLWNLYNKSEEFLVGFHIWGTPCVLIKDPRLIKMILVKDFDNFNHRTVGINYEGDPLGTRLLFSLRNPAWRLMRKKLSSSFSADKIRNLYVNIDAIGDNMVKYLRNHNGAELETKEMFHKYSTDVLTLGAFGIDANCFENADAVSRVIARRIFERSLSRGLQFMTYLILPNVAKALNLKFIEPSSCDYVEKTVAEIKETRDKNGTHKGDFIGRILELEEGRVYVDDRKEIIAQALQFWAAGFETIGSSLMFLFHELAHHPHIQERVRDEILTTLKENNGDLSYDTMRNMTYLNMVTTETYRKYPVLPFLDRVCENDYKIPDTDVTIDAGTNVYISIQGVHYDPENFPEPYKFDPERFHPDNKINETFTYLTFGEGPRHCIGLRFGKISVLVATVKILSKFRVLPVNPYKDMEFDGRGFLLSPKKLIYLKFESL